MTTFSGVPNLFQGHDTIIVNSLRNTPNKQQPLNGPPIRTVASLYLRHKTHIADDKSSIVGSHRNHHRRSNTAMPSPPPPPLPTASMSQAPGASRSGDDDALASRFAAQPTTPPDRRRGASTTTTTMSTSPWQPRDSIGTNEHSATADGAACDHTHGSPAALSLVELQMAAYHQGTAAAALLGIPRPLSWTDGAPARFRTKSECRRALAAAIADVLDDSEVKSLPTANGPGAASGMSAPSVSGGFPGSLWEPSRLFPTQ